MTILPGSSFPLVRSGCHRRSPFRLKDHSRHFAFLSWVSRAAQGDPEPAYAFGRYLEVMLRERFPTVRFEVINTGIAAVNSHVLLPAVRDLAGHNPDLFIFYIGNNEVVGPYGAGTALTRPGGSLALIRGAIFLNSTRLGQLLGRVLRGNREPSAWRGMEMFLKQQVSADAAALGEVYEHFERNLKDIVATAQEFGARVLISTVAVNLKDSAPFASLHRDLSDKGRRDWELRVAEGVKLEGAGHPREALSRYLSAASIDDRYAELQYRIAQTHWRLGEFAAARKRFVLARELDALRFRADDHINETIRRVAKAAGPLVKFVDAEKVFAEASREGVSGGELFYDHVHMSPNGNYILAQALFLQVVPMLPSEVRRSAVTVEPLSQADADRLLALTAHDRRRVALTVITWLSQPPFTARLDNDRQLRALQREAEAITENPEETASSYRSAIQHAPYDRWLRFNYGLYLESRDPAAAEPEFRKALERLPNNYEARAKLADTLIELGRFEEAIAQCRDLLQRMPYHAPAYLKMAYAQARLGSFDQSIADYEHAIELHPAYALDAYTNMGVIQLHLGKFDNAVTSFERAIAADVKQVRTAQLRSSLSYALERLGRHAEAQSVLDQAASLNLAGFVESDNSTLGLLLRRVSPKHRASEGAKRLNSLT